jgi:hypothetical protein
MFSSPFPPRAGMMMVIAIVEPIRLLKLSNPGYFFRQVERAGDRNHNIITVSNRFIVGRPNRGMQSGLFKSRPE